MFLIQFDACNRKELGLSSIGFVLYYDGILMCKHFSIINDKVPDSNYAEYKALIKALEFALSYKIKDLIIEGDAKVLIQQINKICNVNCEHIKPLYNKVVNLKNNFDSINFEHIYRKKNIMADSLANQALYNYFK
jgi:ribonuclease HI